METWATTIKADLELLSGPRVFDNALRMKDRVQISNELALDLVNAICDAGSTRPE